MCFVRKQIYLQSKTLRSEEMRLKGQEIEQWMGFRKLSRDLQQKLRNYRQYVWRETKGVDVGNLLNNLPHDLKRNIKSELGLELLLNVSFSGPLTESLSLLFIVYSFFSQFMKLKKLKLDSHYI